MSTIVGVWTPTAGYIGGDRQITYGTEKNILSQPKVRRLAGWMLVGVEGGPSNTGWVLQQARVDELAPYDLEVDGVPSTFLEAYDKLARWNHARVQALAEGEAGGVLVVCRCGMFYLHREGVTEMGVRVSSEEDRVAAIGSGGEYALGALWWSYNDRDTSRRVHVANALKAAWVFDTGTDGQHDVLSQPWEAP